jgi:hypothetical protein
VTTTTEEAERLAQTHDLVRFTLGMKAPEHDLTATALRSLAAERDALRVENARLREALKVLLTPQTPAAFAQAIANARAALGEKE